MTGITRALARFVANSKYDALPPVIRHEGVRAFVNWVGCAAGASQEDVIQRTLEASVKDCRGSAGRPMTDEDISVKTLVQLRVVFPAQAVERIVADCWKIEQHPLVEPLCKQLGAA